MDRCGLAFRTEVTNLARDAALGKLSEAGVRMTSPLSAEFRSIKFGVETLAAGSALPRHRHAAAYATVVLAGSFEEASFAGRFIAEPGDVLLHGAFDCHANRAVSRRPLQILRLPWDDNVVEGRFRVLDPDRLAAIAGRDPLEALTQLRHDLVAVSPSDRHWSDRLARALRLDTVSALQTWAEIESLAPETVSRGFRRAFGVSPKLFRLQSRARRAWNSIVSSPAPLTTIAQEAQFSDLSHLTRSVVALTGFPPSYWRRRAAGHERLGQIHSS